MNIYLEVLGELHLVTLWKRRGRKGYVRVRPNRSK
jgi:hypothetical protein